MECPLTRREKLPEMRPANRYKKSRALANAALENALEQLVGDALCHHGGSDLQETSAVCTDHQVALGTGSNGCIVRSVEDALHDALQLGIHFLKAPAQTLGVLAHLQAGGGHAAGVGGLCGSVQDTVGQVDLAAAGVSVDDTLGQLFRRKVGRSRPCLLYTSRCV